MKCSEPQCSFFYPVVKANRAQFLWLLVFTLSTYLLLTHTFEILCTVELFGKFFFGSRQQKILHWEQGQFFREQQGSSKLLPKPAPKIPLFLLITRLWCYVRFCIHGILYTIYYHNIETEFWIFSWNEHYCTMTIVNNWFK